MLSNKQKFILSDLSRQAWKRALERAGVAPDDFISEEDFRHEQVARAVAKNGLCCCDQRDYKGVEAHFLSLLGREAAAQASLRRAATEPNRQAEAVLRENLAKFGLSMGYAEAICRRQNKCSVAECSAKQLWRLVYTIRNRGAAKFTASKPAAAPAFGKITYLIKKS